MELRTENLDAATECLDAATELVKVLIELFAEGLGMDGAAGLLLTYRLGWTRFVNFFLLFPKSLAWWRGRLCFFSDF